MPEVTEKSPRHALQRHRGWAADRAARVADRAAAARTDWFAVGVGPAQAQEHILDPAVGHAHDLGRAERARRRGKQEMLRHEDPLAGGPNQHSPARVCQKVQPRIRWWRQLQLFVHPSMWRARPWARLPSSSPGRSPRCRGTARRGSSGSLRRESHNPCRKGRAPSHLRIEALAGAGPAPFACAGYYSFLHSRCTSSPRYCEQHISVTVRSVPVLVGVFPGLQRALEQVSSPCAETSSRHRRGGR